LVYLGTAFKSKNHTTHVISLVTLFLTIVGTFIAALYIYYQLRLYLIQRGDSRWPGESGQPIDLPMSSADLEGKAYTASISSKDDFGAPLVMIDDMSDEMSQVGGRRKPFIHSSSSFNVTPRAPLSRANSLPASGALDVMEYLGKSTPGSLGQHGTATPQLTAGERSGTPSYTEQPLLRALDRLNASALDEPSSERGTASLDLWRPESMTLGQTGRQPPARATVKSGREIAAEADLYARAHGARRRSEYGRSRGDSSAALLGRPPSLDEESAVAL
jgi:hypothetical protein